LKRTILNNTKWIGSLSFIQNIANFGMLIILARFLEPDVFGSQALIISILGFFQIISQIGINFYIIQRHTLTKQHIEYFFGLLVFITSIVMLVIITLFYFLIDRLEFSEYSILIDTFWIWIFILPITNLATFFEALLNREMNFKNTSITNLVSYIIGNVIVTFILVSLNYELEALLIGNLVWQLLKFIINYVPVKTRLKLDFRKKEIKEAIHFGNGIILAKLGNHTALNADNMIVGTILGASSLGFYSRAYSLLMAPVSAIYMILDKLFFSYMSRKQNDLKFLTSLYVSLNTLNFIIFFPFMLVGYFYAEEMIVFLLGSKWIDAAIPFKILLISLPFRSAYRISDILLRSLGKVYLRAVVQWIYAIIIIIGGIIGANFGIEGVATSVSVAIFINYLMMLYISINALKVEKVKIFIQIFLPMSYFTILFFIVFFYLEGESLIKHSYYFLLFLLPLVLLYKRTIILMNEQLLMLKNIINERL
jgi:O-antigen/teichoic acid export membrane protein